MTARRTCGRPPPADPPAAAPLDWAAGDPAVLRRAYETLRPGRLVPGDRWRVVAGAPAVKALLHHPLRRPRMPLKILYFHGGGWFVGSPLTHAGISRGLCHATGLETWSVDYRLLPGHAAAAPLRDGHTVARRLLARDSSLRLILAGDSAGAAIALALAQSLCTRQKSRVLGVVAFYGGYGLTRSPTIASFGRSEDGLDESSLESVYARLAGRGAQHPFTVASLSRHPLPPTLLVVGDRDPLLTDTLLLHRALRASSNDSTLHIVPGAGHSYLHGGGEDDRVRHTMREASAWVWQRCRCAGPR